jgi:hypothetical protein
MIWISRSGVEKATCAEAIARICRQNKMGVYAYEPLHIEALSKTSVYYVFRWKIGEREKLMGSVSSGLERSKAAG